MSASPSLILVVDDDPATRDALAQLLADEGHRTVACDAQDALALAHRERQALVLLDVVMPGLDGPSLCRRLREWHGRNLPVVFVSGVPAHTVAALAVGCDPWDLLIKPCTADELLATVERHLPTPLRPQAAV
jgi:DNA-binding response OmpR family regulator